MNQQALPVQSHPIGLRIFAKVISYIFHPLFIPSFVFYFMTQHFAHEFAGLDAGDAFFRTVVVFINTAFFPAVAIFLLWRLKFIDSIFLKTQRERIAPYMIVMVFYWWVWYLSKNFTDQPMELRVFFLGAFLTTPAALILNNFYKISMHAIAMGSAAAFLLILDFADPGHLGWAVSAAILFTGFVCTSRFIVSDHSNKDIYSGLALGVICQLIAAWVTL
ncbi:MAG: hypothetical protein K0Q66_253 [Chitinophagaceae bacterium]|jgi:hypothetical protein|nr:hypothetical protein [Chitinophagaceae bacterium]